MTKLEETAVLAILRVGGPLTYSEIKRRIGDTNVSNAVMSLIKAGKVESRDGIYSAVESL